LSSDICLAHFVWAPLGKAPLHRFLESYLRYSTGVEHRLVILFDGFRPVQELTAWRRALKHAAHEELGLVSAVLDLAAYRQAVELVPATRNCLWPSRRIFWHGAQENPLVEDNQTGAYLDADAQRWRVLSRYAWGPQVDPAGTEHAEVT
jgi:hypothetical protein